MLPLGFISSSLAMTVGPGGGNCRPRMDQRSAPDTRHHGSVKHSLPFKVGPPHCDVTLRGRHSGVVAERDGLPGQRAAGPRRRRHLPLRPGPDRGRLAGGRRVGDGRLHASSASSAASRRRSSSGFAANEHPPVHMVYDRSGRRVDAAEFHPSWHSLLDIAAWHGLMGRPWVDDPARRPRRPGRPVHPPGPGRGRRHVPDRHDLRLRCRPCAWTRRWPRCGSRS